MHRSIRDYKNIHMVGIKGVGMAALAEVLLRNGLRFTGSDVEEQFMTDTALEKLGIKVKNFDAGNVADKDAIVRSNAYQDNHVEVAAAKSLGIPVFSYPEVAAGLFNSVRGIAIAGSHGKTTTTAMLAHVLKSAGLNLTAIVGSRVIDWQSGAVAGDLSKKDALFVLEADEYKEAFLNYRPFGAIITNIDYDHPDYFPDKQSYLNAFLKFIALIPENGFLIINGNDSDLVGIAETASCKVIKVDESNFTDMKLQSIGNHNLFNANLTLRASEELGVNDKQAVMSLENFGGTARRQEFVGRVGESLIFDDYAHHPTEIQATLSALRGKYRGRQIIAVFQPHTFSRTKALFGQFINAFSDADFVVLADVYASARERKESHSQGVNMENMADGLRHHGKNAVFLKNKDEIAEYIRKNHGNSHAVVITMGAGDIWQVSQELVNNR